MRKYLEVFRLSFKMQIIWRFDVVMTMVATVGRILAAWILWGVIFKDKEMVAGLNFQGMLSYYIISSFLISLDMSKQISDEINYLIRDGGFSKHMVTPMNPFGFFSAMVAGESAFHLGFSFIAAIICALLFQINVVITANIFELLAAITMIVLGLLFMMCFHYLLGMLGFRFIGVDSFLYVANNLSAFFTGALVPLALLPDWVISVMRFFPFYYVTYLPSMLLTGRNSGEIWFGLVVLSSWTLGMFGLSQLTYHKLRIRYDGVGI